ncbi:Hypothetical predicted protein [Lecanosticta acicola]|uniref:Uncharacterized protein n=1 Tax=Lecanosticta acicola TaxID=111012 RepID=A0AAI8Z480_9PEZI|nr:Hypothetical predicted protein [Lecanosticta acicola]
MPLQTANTAYDLATLSPSEQMPQKGPAFYSLPGELRNEIYKLVLCPDGDEKICIADPDVIAAGMSPGKDMRALLLASKQIHAEACGIYAGSNRFFKDLRPSEISTGLREEQRTALQSWIACIGKENAWLVQELELNIHLDRSRPMSRIFGCKVEDVTKQMVLDWCGIGDIGLRLSAAKIQYRIAGWLDCNWEELPVRPRGKRVERQDDEDTLEDN